MVDVDVDDVLVLEVDELVLDVDVDVELVDVLVVAETLVLVLEVEVDDVDVELVLLLVDDVDVEDVEVDVVGVVNGMSSPMDSLYTRSTATADIFGIEVGLIALMYFSTPRLSSFGWPWSSLYAQTPDVWKNSVQKPMFLTDSGATQPMVSDTGMTFAPSYLWNESGVNSSRRPRFLP